MTKKQDSPDKSGKLTGTVPNRVQLRNPVTNRWIKIDTTTGRVISYKRSAGPYKNVRIADQKSATQGERNKDMPIN